MKKIISVILAITVLLSCSMSAFAAEYVKIPVNKNWDAVIYESKGFMGGVIEVSDKTGGSYLYALMDKNGKLLTDFEVGTLALFPDGSYAYGKDVRDKDFITTDYYIIFGKAGKAFKTLQTVKNGQNMNPYYWMVYNISEHMTWESYYAETAIYDTALLPFGNGYHIFSSDGNPIFTGEKSAYTMVDRGVWIELLDLYENRIGWANKNTREFTTTTPANAYTSSGGYGAVKNGDIYEVYNNAGELQFTYDGSQYTCTVAELKFDKNGYAVVHDNDPYRNFKYGMIDTKGNLVLPCEYGWLSDTEAGVIRAVGPHMIYTHRDAYGLIDINGNVILDYQYGYITPFENGVAAFREMFSSDKGGYVDTKGNVITEARYITDDNALGRWGVYVKETGEIKNENPAVALYDRSGRRLTTKQYEQIGQFHEGLAPVLYNVNDSGRGGLDNKWRLGYIDTTGREVIPAEYRFTIFGESSGSKLFKYSEMPLFKSGATILSDGSRQYIVHNPLMTHGVNALKNASTVMVNGEKIAVDAYTINGFNYFKLRDVATMLNGTEKQFNVGWNTVKGAIDIQTGKGYSAELVSDGQSSANARLSYPIVYQNGVLLNEFNDDREQTYGLTAYDLCINDQYGNTFFQLRDLGKLLDFNVSFDAVNNCISIDTTKPY
ncbi:MAG: WG repeat-containing protein [Firmicutes bacterium]|nr:WG repeat-containing protein [Bacillota bacterium]